MELAHFDAAVNGNVNEFPFSDIDQSDLSDIFNKFSPSGNSLLHVAATFGRVEITRLMARHFPSLITTKNSQGDTVLHVAARAGRFLTAKTVVEEYANQFSNTSQSQSQLVMNTNLRGNTSLHEALVALQASMDATFTSNKTTTVDLTDVVSLACFLVESAGPEVCYCKNKAGKSPLFLAVECGNKDFLEYILKALREPDENDAGSTIIGKCLADLMIEKQLNLDVLKLMKEVKPKLLSLRDEKGNTLLHSAASIGYVEGVCKLLELRSDSVLERNNEGYYAIHFACEKGSVRIMKELLKKWPHPTELLNNKGQNILHVAAKSGNEYVVRHILKLENSDALINMMDQEGNTPLHLAARHSQSFVVGTLMLDKRSRKYLKFINDQGQTAYDITVQQYQMVQNQQFEGKSRNVGSCQLSHGCGNHIEIVNRFETLMTLSILFVINNIVVRRLGLTEDYLRAVKGLHNQCRPAEKEDVNQTLDNALVVATLIVGLAFAASVQVSSSDSGEGSESNHHFHLLSQNQTKVFENWSLQCFTIVNTIAIVMAVAGALFIRLAKVSDPIFASVLVAVAATAGSFALWLILWAFISTIILRIHSYSIFTVGLVTVLLVVYLVFQLPFYLILFVASLREGLVLFFYFLLFWSRYFTYRILTLFVGGCSIFLRCH